MGKIEGNKKPKYYKIRNSPSRKNTKMEHGDNTIKSVTVQAEIIEKRCPETYRKQER